MTALTHAILRPSAPQSRSAFAADLLAGLAATPKRIPPKYFYDPAGSRLFERITELPEYYPTRAERGVLKDRAREIARFVPEGAALVEFGSGSSEKVRLLLGELPALSAYVPVDISAEFLDEEAARLRRDFPRLSVVPVAADFTQPFALPPAVLGRPRAGFFPGSTIGNFEPEEAQTFLRHAARILGSGAALIIGVDLVKDARVLNAAYNDAAGVTAAFNLNVLARANRELGANFDVNAFAHRAVYNAPASRIEMHLVSRKSQTVRVLDRAFAFAPGETIHTENSYKHTLDGFARLAARAGWRAEAAWTDADELFSVHALQAKGVTLQ
ncbi:MAG TPA: L-histidine N(alpha)-methyltransferase [Beijerinckiaceae bacterium]|nr:L-histidine N(alpha)-methyltransferase [Beijerinckiaceae bacterium]